MNMNSSDLDLIAASLNFAHWSKPVFQAFCRDYGSYKTAANADRLDYLRQEINVLRHEAQDAEWENGTHTFNI
jgi:hypothetical protein